MKENDRQRDWLREYHAFESASKVRPPAVLSREIKSIFWGDLNPSVARVFAKLVVIHFVAGTLTLLFCPQFGIALFERTHALIEFFLHFGEHGCMIACGAIFLGSTGLVAGFLLRLEEIRVIRKTKFLQLALLALLSLGCFLAFSEQERAMPIGLALAWLVGSVAGGFFSIQLGWKLRLHTRLPSFYR